MTNQTILITGISGFIGKRVANYFLDLGFFVIAPVRSSIETKNKNLIICSYKNLESIISKKKIDYIYHFASLTRVNHNDQDLIYKTNLELADYVCKLARICHPKMIIFSSTISVYGEISNPFLTFNCQINKNRLEAYGKSKLIAEEILTKSSIMNRFKLVVLRLPGVIGYGSHSNLISKVIKKLYSENNEPLCLYNPENMFNNIIDIATLNSYLEQLISPKYNQFKRIKTIIACKEPLRIIDVVELIIKNLGFDESYNKKIVWKLSESNSFVIDSNYQEKFLLKTITTEKCIHKLCKDILLLRK